MLVLTRNIGETIKIGKDVEVQLVAVEGNQIRLGVNAPKVLPVTREEIYQRLFGEDQAPAIS